MITWEVWSRVVRFQGESKRPGTAFLLGAGSGQLLVTARHLCTGAPDEVVSITHPWTDDGKPIYDNGSRVGMNVSPEADFAIFRLSEPITSVGGDVPLNSNGLNFTQEAYILGYPYGLSFQLRESAQQLPITKRCIVSAMTADNDGTSVFLIDTLVNPGFSGGPLVFINTQTGAPNIAGVVVKGSIGPLYEATGERPSPPEGPTGIGVVVGDDSFRAAVYPAIGPDPRS